MNERDKERSKREESLVTKRKRYSLAAGIAVLGLCFGVYFLLQVETVQRSYLYPYPYQNSVRRYAEMYGVDSNLAVAVIREESGFRPRAKSHSGAMGLMQLMPTTAEWISWQLDEEFAPKHLEEPDTNIRYGIWYLSSLEAEFGGNEVLMLAAYNAGRGNVEDWMERFGWGRDFANIAAIPYPETRQYVRRVLKTKRRYEGLYQMPGKGN